MSLCLTLPDGTEECRDIPDLGNSFDPYSYALISFALITAGHKVCAQMSLCLTLPDGTEECREIPDQGNSLITMS